jgi:magnesium and cobalt exporter, CNNM family
MSLVLVSIGLALVVLSALLSAAETATFALDSSQLRTLESEGFQGADKLNLLREDPEETRSSLIVTSTAFDGAAVGLLTVSGWLETAFGGPLGGMLASLVITVIVAEILPRAFSNRRTVRVALGMAPTVTAVVRTVNRIRSPLGRLGSHLNRRRDDESSTPEARLVREMTEIGQEEGVVDAKENLLVERAFRLDERTAWDVMTPRVDVFSWKDSLTLEEIVKDLSDVTYSRVPVHGDSVDDITGILHVREALEAYVDGRTDVPLSTLAREPLFVPGSSQLTGLLEKFQSRRIHMGIVADEFGGTDGLVTLEDVLEELVGEIVDETDAEEESIIRMSRNEMIVNASTDLREVNEAFDVALPQLEHRSLNGLFLEELGHVPAIGEALSLAGVHLEVMEATDTQVLKVRMTRIESNDESESE